MWVLHRNYLIGGCDLVLSLSAGFSLNTLKEFGLSEVSQICTKNVRHANKNTNEDEVGKVLLD